MDLGVNTFVALGQQSTRVGVAVSSLDPAMAPRERGNLNFLPESRAKIMLRVATQNLTSSPGDGYPSSR